jgi:hypothetical protein
MNQEHIDKLKNAGNFLQEEKQVEVIVAVSSAATSSNTYKVYYQPSETTLSWYDKWIVWR